jgi:NAD(P)-dependent dehydrogenase (short-subunit alcohol dehydrogenase family)
VTDSSFRKTVFAAMTERFGPVSICVPAAGITRDKLAVPINKESGRAEIYSEADWERVISVDLTAPIYWAMETIASVAEDRFARGLRRWSPDEKVQGCIVFIGSVSSAGNRGQISYATAKAGLEGAQETLAAEAIFYGVRSAIIHPGYTDTNMVRSLGEKVVHDRILPHTQLGRLIRPEEIADAIVFLIRNSAVSGTLWADAGWHPSP